MSGSRKAVFVDRDGTLNEMVYDENHGTMDSPRRPEQVMAKPGAGAFLKGLKEAGYFVVVVTNQPGIAKGTLTLGELDAVNARLIELLAEEGGSWDALEYSPYHPGGGTTPVAAYVKDSDCRKPKPGMLLNAAEKYDLDLSNSWMVGDGLVDIQAGKAAGCKTVLVTNLKIETISRFLELDAEPDVLSANLGLALPLIISGNP